MAMRTRLRFSDATPEDAPAIAALRNAAAGALTARCGYRERGRVTYKGNPLVYYELLLH